MLNLSITWELLTIVIKRRKPRNNVKQNLRDIIKINTFSVIKS